MVTVNNAKAFRKQAKVSRIKQITELDGYNVRNRLSSVMDQRNSKYVSKKNLNTGD